MPCGVFMHAVYTMVVDVYIIDNYRCIGLLYTYSVRLLRCSFYSVGSAKASDSGMSNRHGLSRFFCVLFLLYLFCLQFSRKSRKEFTYVLNLRV